MAMVAVNSASIIHDSVTKIATLLQNNCTDPISATRAQSTWIMTSYPERDVEYPIIIVAHAAHRDEHTSIGSEYKTNYITLRIEVWSKSTKQRDEVWDDVYDELRHHYKTADANGDSIQSIGLRDPTWGNAMDLDTLAPKGRGHIHRKISTIQFTFYATS